MNDRALVKKADSDLERRNRIVTLLLAVTALTVPVAYFSGTLLWRWGPPVDLASHRRVLETLPDHLGPWRFVAAGTPIAPEIERLLELRGHVHRVYENPATGQRAAVLVLMGPAGPLVRHPPEICYQSGANELLESEPIAIDCDGTPQALRLLSYRPEAVVLDEFLVAYGFSADGQWDCPKLPRLAYGGKPVLYKLQVLTEVARGQLADGRQGLMDLLQYLLPALGSSSTNDSSTDLASNLTAADVVFHPHVVVGSSWHENVDLIRSRNQ